MTDDDRGEDIFADLPGRPPLSSGAQLLFHELPPVHALRPAAKTFGVSFSPGDGANPHGERGDAAQMAGALKAAMEFAENGLRGGELQTQFQKGYLSAYRRNAAAVLGSLSERAGDSAQLAVEMMMKAVPRASRQLCLAALAFQVANHALDAAAQIAAGPETWDGDRIQASGLNALETLWALTQYGDKVAAQWKPGGQEQ